MARSDVRPLDPVSRVVWVYFDRLLVDAGTQTSAVTTVVAVSAETFLVCYNRGKLTSNPPFACSFWADFDGLLVVTVCCPTVKTDCRESTSNPFASLIIYP